MSINKWIKESFYLDKFKDMKIETQCIHIGKNPDWVYGAVNTPIYASSTFEFQKAGEPMGKWCYSLLDNPTKLALERLLAQIEGGKNSLVFSAGIAEIISVVDLVKPSEEIISINDLY